MRMPHADHLPRRFLKALTLCLLAALSACRAIPPGEDIPTYPDLTDQQILDRLADRADAIQTLSASGTLRLEDPERGTVTLDVVLLAEGDNRLRLRAWKLGRAVFDLTHDGEALWLWTRESDDESAASALTAERVRIGWDLMSGRIFAQPPILSTSSDPLVLTYTVDQPTQTVADFDIDRKTVTVARCTVRSADGTVQQQIRSSDYRLITDIPIGTRIQSTGSDERTASFTLEFIDVEINTELPATAFTPPRDAKRSP